MMWACLARSNRRISADRIVEDLDQYAFFVVLTTEYAYRWPSHPEGGPGTAAVPPLSAAAPRPAKTRRPDRPQELSEPGPSRVAIPARRCRGRWRPGRAQPQPPTPSSACRY